MKKKLILLGGVLLLVLLVVFVFGFVFLGSIVKAGVENVGPMVTKVPVKLEGAAVGLFSGKGELKGFELGNPEGFKTANAMKVGTIGVEVVPKSVLADKIVIHSVRVEAPEITFETDMKGNNLSKILANVQSLAGTNNPAADKATKSKKLQVDEFVLSGGKIHLSASLMNGKSATLPLPEIRLNNLGQGPDGITPVELTERIMSAVVSGTLKAVAEGGAQLAKESAKAATENVKNVGTEATKSLQKVGDMFKKK